MSAEPVPLGYVGCGFMAQNVHLPDFASLQDCRLVALAEARPRLAQRVAARYGIPTVYHSHLDLAANPSVEAVGGSARFSPQGEVPAPLLRARAHGFLEKHMEGSAE